MSRKQAQNGPSRQREQVQRPWGRDKLSFPGQQEASVSGQCD